jgi:hypothetical protein
MRLDITRYDCEMIVDYLRGNPLKCYKKHAAGLAEHLIGRLKGEDKTDPKRTFVPMGIIRAPRLDAHIKPAKKRNWSYRPAKQGTLKVKPQPKPTLTAQQILDSIV